MPLEFPKRAETHEIESASWGLLKALAPEEWILREVSERDYGIDAYIEIASKDRQITGNLISVQLKGVKTAIHWKAEGSGVKRSKSPQIKVSTANYWLHLPVPVFLFVADLPEKKIHFVSVKESIRKQYGKLAKQDKITFPLIEEFNISSKIGRIVFQLLVARERAHEHFAFHITNLLSHIAAFADFISANQNRDSFMEVELDAHMQFRALYETCRMASVYLDNEWDLPSLNELYLKDRAQWKDDFALLHESSIDFMLQKLESKFIKLVKRAIEVVSQEQAEYWRGRDPIFQRLCSNGELEWTVKQIQHQLGHS